jgi:hypothetical protein
MPRISAILLIFCAFLLIAAAPASMRSFDIPRPGTGVAPEYSSLDPQSTALGSLTTRYGGSWSGYLNPQTGTAHLIYGSGIDLRMGRIEDAKQAETAARAFVAANEDVFAADPAELVTRSVENGLGKWSVIFGQTLGGKEIYGSRVIVVMTEAGRAYAFGSDIYPRTQDAKPAVLDEAQAVVAAQRSLDSDPARDEVKEVEAVLLPVAGEEETVLRAVYRVHLRSQSPYGDWMSFVDAADGAVLWRYNRVHTTNVVGAVDADAEDMGYCDGLSLKAMANMRVNVSGGSSANTDAAGQYDITHAGTAPVTVTAQFIGPWFSIDRYTGTNPTFSGTATPGTPFAIHWGSANSRADERDCWLHCNRIHDWIKAIDPAFTALDYAMPVSVGRTDLYCPGNAWWDGTGVNFCESSATYGNTGQMGDVIYHEYTHGITQEVYGTPEPTGDMHEGNSDIGDNYNTRFSLIGPGFYLNNCTTGIRNSDNTMIYPDDWTGENHTSGQIIAGVHWDMWQDLLVTYPQAQADSVAMYMWHYARKLYKPLNQPDQVASLFVMDDDDGNLSNGTPHYDAICLGASNHGFSCPEITVGVMISHTPLGSTTDIVGPYAVTATITSTLASLEPDSLLVHYDVGGGWQTALMTATGTPDQYRAWIPGQPCGTAVNYYISGADVLGNRKTHPAGAPASFHSFRVVGAAVAHHDFEAAGGWTVGDTGDNATTGIWERGDPQATFSGGQQAQPEDDVTAAPGVNCYATQVAAGASAGAYDVDTGKTTLKSPIFDLSNYASAVAEFYLWVFSGTTGQELEPITVSASSNGGTAWTTLLTKTDAGGWELISIDVGAYIALTNQVQFRFVIQDPTPGALVEAALDEFQILGCPMVDTQLPLVAVSAPNGTEQWIEGEHHDITWTATDNVGVTGVDILLSTDGGLTYPTVIATGEANDGVYDWTVSGGPADSCLVKVLAGDAANNWGEDVSDDLFEIVEPSTAVEDQAPPVAFALLAPAPNPTNGRLTVRYEIPVGCHVALGVYDVAGREVRRLINADQGPGRYSIGWDGRTQEGSAAAAGVYFTRLLAGAFEARSRVVVLK